MIRYLFWKIYVQDLSVLTAVMAACVLAWGLLMGFFRGVQRSINRLILPVCVLAILWVTMNRGGGKRELVLMPFFFLIEAQTQPELYRSMLMNVFLFLPFGMSLPFALPENWRGKGRKAVLAALVFSIGIELAQYLWGLGRCETDDVLMNTLGACLGAASFWTAQWMEKREQSVKVTRYTLDAPFDLRIALVTDLHERNGKRVQVILEREQPELVCVAGDTFECIHREDDYAGISKLPLLSRLLVHGAFWLNDALYGLRGISRKTDPREVYELLKSLRVPVFLSLGNHDPVLSERDRAVLTDAGVTVLDNSSCPFLWQGRKIWIGGLSSNPDEEWLREFTLQRGYKLLLCHHPDYYPKYLSGKQLDLILSGHVHGGQVRIAGRGLFAPGQGFFPKYHHGVYHHKMVVSAGCSDTTALPRWGNPCEVVIVQLKKGAEQ